MPASPDATYATPALLIQPGQTMPGFALPDANAAIIRLRSYRQRRPVLIALLHSATCPDCLAWLSALVPAREELEYLTVQLLLIFPDDSPSLSALQHELALSGKLLSDPCSTARNRYVRSEEPPALPVVALVAVGRYNECLDAWVADEPSQWPSLTEIMATFAFAEQEDCACGLPIWPGA
ncbi:MAG TPA: redoxin domain-containing protein [Ktedonobacterales bacterium]|nr:redoxin domain-containing protein [Ktedonobacterales bacterium]